MAISPLWCSLISVSLFNTLMMEVKDVGKINDKSINPDAMRIRIRRKVSVMVWGCISFLALALW